MTSRASRHPAALAPRGRGRNAAARHAAVGTDSRAAALYNRSLELLSGRGVLRDEEAAFRLNEEAALLGDRDAVLAMGWFYNHGIGVACDDELSRRWYREAARNHEPRAMFSLGAIAFEHGDSEEAFTWLRRAADTGHARSLYWLGKLHWRGEAVPRDRKEAMRLFQLAAARRVPEARRALRLFARLARRPRSNVPPRR